MKSIKNNFCCEYIHQEDEVIKHYSQNTKLCQSKSLQTKKTLCQQNPRLEEKDLYQKCQSMSNQEKINLNIEQEEEIKPSIFLVQHKNQEKQIKKLKHNEDCDYQIPQQIIDIKNKSTHFKSQTNSDEQEFDQNRNSITASKISDNQFADKLTRSLILNLSASELVQSQNDCQSQFQTQNISQFPNNFDYQNDCRSLQNNTYLSKAQVLKVLCKYCDQWVSQNYIQLECQHNYCIECFKEELKQQCQTSECIKFYCRCTIKISEKTIHQLRNDKLMSNILNKLRWNRQIKLTSYIQKLYKTWTCPNKYCQFICIFQENLNINLFYCPNCSKDLPVYDKKK